MMKPFQAIQLAFTEYLRSGSAGEPRGRRQEIYRDSVYKNITYALSDIFPTTKRIIQESRWDSLMRAFIRDAHLRTPSLHNIGEEFLAYLMHQRNPPATDNDQFLIEIAHFEWIQLALYMADIELPERSNSSPPAGDSLWKASPLAIGLTYSHPVHLIDGHDLPIRIEKDSTHLLVYRNRNDDVEVLAIDPLSLRIVQLLQAHEGITQLQQFQLLAGELSSESHDIACAKMQDILVSLADKEILFYQ